MYLGFAISSMFCAINRSGIGRTSPKKQILFWPKILFWSKNNVWRIPGERKKSLFNTQFFYDSLSCDFTNFFILFFSARISKTAAPFHVFFWVPGQLKITTFRHLIQVQLPEEKKKKSISRYRILLWSQLQLVVTPAQVVAGFWEAFSRSDGEIKKGKINKKCEETKASL